MTYADWMNGLKGSSSVQEFLNRVFVIFAPDRPLSLLMLYFTTGFVNTSPLVILEHLPLILGPALVIAVYLLTRELFSNERTSMIAAIPYSRNVISYINRNLCRILCKLDCLDNRVSIYYLSLQVSKKTLKGKPLTVFCSTNHITVESCLYLGCIDVSCWYFSCRYHSMEPVTYPEKLLLFY